MLVSSNTFDNSTFLYKQLKFTWLVWVAIAVDVGGEIDAVGTQSRFTTPIASLFPDPKFLMTVSGLDILPLLLHPGRADTFTTIDRAVTSAVAAPQEIRIDSMSIQRPEQF
jgi:hypothetical protein